MPLPFNISAMIKLVKSIKRKGQGSSQWDLGSGKRNADSDLGLKNVVIFLNCSNPFLMTCDNNDQMRDDSSEIVPVWVLTSLAASRSQILRLPAWLPAHTSSSVCANLNKNLDYINVPYNVHFSSDEDPIFFFLWIGSAEDKHPDRIRP